MIEAQDDGVVQPGRVLDLLKSRALVAERLIVVREYGHRWRGEAGSVPEEASGEILAFVHDQMRLVGADTGAAEALEHGVPLVCISIMRMARRHVSGSFVVVPAKALHRLRDDAEAAQQIQEYSEHAVVGYDGDRA